MTYFCFIESSIMSVPNMESLAATAIDEAVREAVDLMRLHGSAIAVHVFLDDEEVESVLADNSLARSFSEARQTAAI